MKIVLLINLDYGFDQPENNPLPGKEKEIKAKIPHDFFYEFPCFQGLILAQEKRIGR